ncbi:MAG: RNA polymerase sigma factor [Cellulosilyticaceae bacterium]
MNGAISKEEAEKIFDTYKDYIYQSALFLTHSPELADDVTQEVFIRAIVYYHTYDAKRPIKTWLYKMMLNVTRTMMKKQKSYMPLEEMIEVQSEHHVEDDVVVAETNKELLRAIDGLGDKIKQVLYMHYYLEMTLEEIAEILEIPVGTCKSRLHTGLRRLRYKKSKIIQLYGRERVAE